MGEGGRGWSQNLFENLQAYPYDLKANRKRSINLKEEAATQRKKFSIKALQIGFLIKLFCKVLIYF